MRNELTITELEAETVELLPARETLHVRSFHFGDNTATVDASNWAQSVQAYTFHSHASSTALQAISIHQG